MTVATHDLFCESTAAGQARQFTADALRHLLPRSADAEALVHDAVLCVSELVTNAVNAGCKAMTLAVQMSPYKVRLSLIDDAPGLPVLRSPRPDEPSGRGLIIVSALAKSWGVDPAASGKEIWAELERNR
jgi:anti-sigma regulatory factor (Ser/Thr protein kinase)